MSLRNLSKSFATLLALTTALILSVPASAQQAKPSVRPQVMQFCGLAHCATLTWNNGKYDAVFDNIKGTSTYNVEIFSPESVRIIRHDGGGGTAVLTGRLSPQNDRIVDGEMTWTSGATGTFPFTMTWGTAAAARPSLTSPLAPGRQGEMMVGNVPRKLHVCETNASSKVERCGTWDWTADRYTAVWNDKNVETVAIDRWTPHDIAVHMVADPGGFLQTCRGKPQGEGTFAGDTVTTWSGHWSNSPFGPGISEGTWTAQVIPAESPSYQRCSVGSAPGSVSDPRGHAETAFRAGDVISGACWARVAAMRGEADSQAAYGLQLLRGLGVPADLAESFRWTQKAAQQGQIDAQLRLAQMYEGGVGVSVDTAQAQYWQNAHSRSIFSSILALAQNGNEKTLVDAINACKQNPAYAQEFFGQCRSAYIAHIRMLRNQPGDRSVVEACREEYSLTQQVSRECILLKERIALDRQAAISTCTQQKSGRDRPINYDICASDYDSRHEDLLHQLP